MHKKSIFIWRENIHLNKNHTHISLPPYLNLKGSPKLGKMRKLWQSAQSNVNTFSTSALWTSNREDGSATSHTSCHQKKVATFSHLLTKNGVASDPH